MLMKLFMYTGYVLESEFPVKVAVPIMEYPSMVKLHLNGAVLHYRIALNFRGSKFLRIEIFEEFVEIISRIRCMRTLHAVCQKIFVEIFS